MSGALLGLLLLPAEALAGVPLGKGICRPDCRGKTCGPNGCGGSCGTCAKGSACFKNRCVKGHKGDPCVAMTGAWTGIMPATGSHPAEYLRGRVWGTTKACRARFRVSYRRGNGANIVVIEHFKVTIWGPRTRRRAKFVCTKITYVTPTSYSKDTFTGTLNLHLTRFRGKVVDTAGSTSPVYLKKK